MSDRISVAARRRAHFHPLVVSGLRRLTEDAVEVTLAVPEELAGRFNYTSGQYVAMSAVIDGREVRRSYSLCAEPVPGSIRVAIKATPGGVFSTWANECLRVGDVLEVMAPMGAFVSKHALTELNDPQGVAARVSSGGVDRFAAVAAGSGITPVVAIAGSVLASNPRAVFELVFANRTANDVMFVEELADLKDRYPARFAVHHVLSREQRQSPLHSGRIDDEKIRVIFDRVFRAEKADEFFLCGPFELVQMVRAELSRRGVSEERVRYELFSSGRPVEERSEVGAPVAADPRGEVYTIAFTLDGLSGEVESPRSARESVLNAALRVRGDVPFACAGGVCGTCRAKVVEGELSMDENYALEPDEVAQGYVLTCQARPVSDRVSVTFDA
ncbi:ring-1,2-phenylacetyl-CoA epoxidase subunit PaaE [Austwickia chelonae]|uniref:Phenylacetate-CoA oxygenase subunit PaaK n=1 Tax=Austwickia chelonae NBRC 105200 TaxID=1184607 RepID=K6VR74_9MICO|nr:1,2-phenylacetyl-CoA epoxidase subunit PaaE [Austwickia chelonae]GAB79254.1 phenylacetate-CoA oxygenase subunit PaaK [Austwickia chelonae NBRC 105200]SEW37627.1 ring-1,2-phenylacetyl-CoA epoxidase subunit PaaE [Austwickia chelonae]